MGIYKNILTVYPMVTEWECDIFGHTVLALFSYSGKKRVMGTWLLIEI